MTEQELVHVGNQALVCEQMKTFPIINTDSDKRLKRILKK